ncbi:hypothetical protein NPIL_115282 [Nephila pilipes]|uniref:Uncharacterized protein n=1 Tax=Nephila pilipes TaxID=299642 RepID=A0A8X6PBX9_NEPPI|nr:hypothetical protein NPIL_115282 [Nephila pilipes]
MGSRKKKASKNPKKNESTDQAKNKSKSAASRISEKDQGESEFKVPFPPKLRTLRVKLSPLRIVETPKEENEISPGSSREGETPLRIVKTQKEETEISPGSSREEQPLFKVPEVPSPIHWKKLAISKEASAASKVNVTTKIATGSSDKELKFKVPFDPHPKEKRFITIKLFPAERTPKEKAAIETPTGKDESEFKVPPLPKRKIAEMFPAYIIPIGRAAAEITTDSERADESEFKVPLFPGPEIVQMFSAYNNPIERAAAEITTDSERADESEFKVPPLPKRKIAEMFPAYIIPIGRAAAEITTDSERADESEFKVPLCPRPEIVQMFSAYINPIGRAAAEITTDSERADESEFKVPPLPKRKKVEMFSAYNNPIGRAAAEITTDSERAGTVDISEYLYAIQLVNFLGRNYTGIPGVDYPLDLSTKVKWLFNLGLCS